MTTVATDPGPRFEDTHAALPIGTLCHTEWRGENVEYLFLGFMANTAGRFAVFARTCHGGWAASPNGYLLATGFTYHATYTLTILRKFPDLPQEAR